MIAAHVDLECAGIDPALTDDHAACAVRKVRLLACADRILVRIETATPGVRIDRADERVDEV